MTKNAYLIPWVAVGLGLLYFLATMLPPSYSAREMNLAGFGALPVVDGGRVKPMDTLARTNLMIISGRQIYRDEQKKSYPAIKWLLDVMTNSGAYDQKVLRIENDQVLSFLGLESRPGSFRYSFAELYPHLDKIQDEAKRARNIDAKEQSLFDQKILELFHHLNIFTTLAFHGILAVPPTSPGEDWTTIDKALREQNPAVEPLREILLAYKSGQVDTFNQGIREYQKKLEKQHQDSEIGTTSFEVFFNHFSPFYRCILVYVMVFIMVMLAWLFGSEHLKEGAFWLAVLTVVIHSWALFARMYIQGRPPVTNLYSSAVFIGWGGVLLGLFLERIYRLGVGTAVAAVMGANTLIIAHYLAQSGDTLEMMQAVLDTNFWLATHVTIITLGYVATFVAGAIGLGFILVGVFSKMLNRELTSNLGKMIYGVLCFATFLSFLGTVLGGIWADQSWGRFWGWDPKENGALIIVLWNALILHARWGGMIKQRGMACLAVGGNIVTAWSWFGVNMLGVGLHSYGFMKGAVFWLLFFVATQLLVIGLGLLPNSLWHGNLVERVKTRIKSVFSRPKAEIPQEVG